jgi:hypothetical protein
MQPTLVRQRVYQTLDGLPPQGLEELSQFLDFLRYKYKTEQQTNIVALGGMWQDTVFDVTDEEIRALRRQVTDTLLSKV